MSDLQTFSNFLSKKSFISQNFRRFLLVIYRKILISSTKNSDDLFLVISSISAQTNLFVSFILKIHAFQHSFLRFSTVPVQNLQLQLHNSHFTTASYILPLHKLS